MLDNPVIRGNPNRIAVWWYLLLNATHDEQQAWFINRSILLTKGQLITGRMNIEQTTGIANSTVQNILKLFENEHLIEQQTSNKNRLITILKWDKWQINEQQNKQPMNNKQTTDEQPMNTYNKVKNDKNEKNLSIAALAATPFSFEGKLHLLRSSKDERMNITALYWEKKDLSFPSKEAYEAGLRRELHPAGELKGYGLPRITAVIDYLEKYADFKWTLETVVKYINEDLNKLILKTKGEDEFLTHLGAK